MQELNDQIIINEGGVFIPKRVFGQTTRILETLNRIGVFAAPPETSRPGNGQANPPVSPVDCSRELQWLKEHRDEYVGQWVALDGDRLISHGANARQVAEAARAAGVAVPFLTQVDPPEELPSVGYSR